MKRAAMMVLLVVVLALMVGSASAGTSESESRFWMKAYAPPQVLIGARLAESSTDVTIEYDGYGFEVEFSGVQICQPGFLSVDDMSVFAAALDYALQTAKAMPE